MLFAGALELHERGDSDVQLRQVDGYPGVVNNCESADKFEKGVICWWGWAMHWSEFAAVVAAMAFGVSAAKADVFEFNFSGGGFANSGGCQCFTITETGTFTVDFTQAPIETGGGETAYAITSVSGTKRRI